MHFIKSGTSRSSLNKAIIYMLISTFAFAGMNALVKFHQDFSSFQVVFFRALGTWVICMILMIRKGIHPLGNQRKLLFLRGMLGVASITLFFTAVQEIALGSAVSLRYISPVFASLFAIWVLKEKVRPRQWIFFMMAFSGVLVLKGFDTSINPKGFLMILASAFFMGWVYVVIRMIGERDHPLVVINYFMFLAMVIGGTFSIPRWVQPIGWDWFSLLSMGIFGYFGQRFMTEAFQLVPTNTIAPMKYLEVIYALLVGLIFFKEAYSVFMLLGISMIIGGMILNLKTKKT